MSRIHVSRKLQRWNRGSSVTSSPSLEFVFFSPRARFPRLTSSGSCTVLCLIFRLCSFIYLVMPRLLFRDLFWPYVDKKRNIFIRAQLTSRFLWELFMLMLILFVYIVCVVHYYTMCSEPCVHWAVYSRLCAKINVISSRGEYTAKFLHDVYGIMYIMSNLCYVLRVASKSAFHAICHSKIHVMCCMPYQNPRYVSYVASKSMLCAVHHIFFM